MCVGHHLNRWWLMLSSLNSDGLCPDAQLVWSSFSVSEFLKCQLDSFESSDSWSFRASIFLPQYFYSSDLIWLLSLNLGRQFFWTDNLWCSASLFFFFFDTNTRASSSDSSTKRLRKKNPATPVSQVSRLRTFLNLKSGTGLTLSLMFRCWQSNQSFPSELELLYYKVGVWNVHVWWCFLALFSRVQ